jgi:hypothetical protein
VGADHTRTPGRVKEYGNDGKFCRSRVHKDAIRGFPMYRQNLCADSQVYRIVDAAERTLDAPINMIGHTVVVEALRGIPGELHVLLSRDHAVLNGGHVGTE